MIGRLLQAHSHKNARLNTTQTAKMSQNKHISSFFILNIIKPLNSNKKIKKTTKKVLTLKSVYGIIINVLRNT